MRPTGPLFKVLRAFLDEPGREVYGLEVLRATGLKSGTLYPLLDRLEKSGWVESRWEDAPPSQGGRPRRRFYRLTGIGLHEARQMLVEHGLGPRAWVQA
jgi:PadR family transcriptional regulator PadR